MVKIKDVAAMAGVSPATVSRVMMNKGNISEKTRAKVLRNVDLLGYRPNALAKQLRQQRTHTVYVIVPNFNNSFFYEVCRGIESVALDNQYQIYLVNANNDKSQESLYISALMQKQTDGIISISAVAAMNVVEQQIVGLPMVISCQYLENCSIPNVAIDNVLAATEATAHLVDLGHRKIGHLSGPANHVLYRDRLTGYLRALTEKQVEVDMNYVSFGDSTFMSGYERTLELLNGYKEITAIFASGDSMAIGAMKAAKELGRRIPEDCAVVGFDDLEIASFCDPPLTTIQQPTMEIGIQSMQLLLDLIQKKTTEHQRLLDYKLIVRGSTVKDKTTAHPLFA